MAFRPDHSAAVCVAPCVSRNWNCGTEDTKNSAIRNFRSILCKSIFALRRVYQSNGKETHPARVVMRRIGGGPPDGEFQREPLRSIGAGRARGRHTLCDGPGRNTNL